VSLSVVGEGVDLREISGGYEAVDVSTIALGMS